MLTAFDYAVFFVLVASGLIGALRGLVREILSLAGWILAFWVAYTYSGVAAEWIPESLPGGAFTRTLAGFVLLFVATVIGTALVSTLLAQVLSSTGLKPADRGLGFVFGILRGGVLVMFLVILAGFTTLPEEPFWRDAVTRPTINQLMDVLRPWLPPDLGQYLKA
jgi:membrane protein required for colicin V production